MPYCPAKKIAHVIPNGASTYSGNIDGNVALIGAATMNGIGSANPSPPAIAGAQKTDHLVARSAHSPTFAGFPPKNQEVANTTKIVTTSGNL